MLDTRTRAFIVTAMHTHTIFDLCRNPSAFSRRAVVSYWRKYVHEVLVNRLGGLSLPRKSVVRLTDRADMTLDVYRGRKTTMQQQQNLYRKGFTRYVCIMMHVLLRQIRYYVFSPVPDLHVCPFSITDACNSPLKSLLLYIFF